MHTTMTGREDIFQKAMNDGHSAAWDQMWQDAAVYYRSALEEFPDDPQALNSLGLALFQLQRDDQALQIYKHAAEVSLDDPIPVEKIFQLSERVGNMKDAIEFAVKAGDLYLKNQEVDKAIENWMHVTELNNDHVIAHSHLASAYERLGQIEQAVSEYLAVASLLQRSGKLGLTAELIDKSLLLLPDSPEAKKAQDLLKSNQLLPSPAPPKGSTGPIRRPQVQELEAPPQLDESNLDPIAEAHQRALAQLAEILFKYSEESDGALLRPEVETIMRDVGQMPLQKTEQNKVFKHLGKAIEAQNKNQGTKAAEELERALEAGFNHPALYFNLGLLRSKSDRFESALRQLLHAVKHNDFALGTHLLMGEIYRKMGRLSEAATEYLEALKLADSMTIPPQQANELRQLYEPLIKSHSKQKDEDELNRLCDTINNLLVRPNWRNETMNKREQLPKPLEGELPLPLAEVLVHPQISQKLEVINNVRQMASAGRMRSAMDEAFQGILKDPSYLPLHSLIVDLLIQDGRVEDAIAKLLVVARAYRTRGELTQAMSLLHRVIHLAPMDFTARHCLIEQLTDLGEVDATINEYLDLANMYYRLVELDMARKTYTDAWQYAQRAAPDSTKNVKILQHIVDIDMQMLDWHRALPIFEQIRDLTPEDDNVRKNLISLYIRLSQQPRAMAEMGSYLSYLESNDRSQEAITFLEDLLNDYGDQLEIQRALAEQYRRAGKIEEAVAQLDALGEALLKAGNKEGAVEAINLILSMNPPKAEKYQKLLDKIQP